MSDRITWVRCPNCRDAAAVGWTTVPGHDAKPLAEIPTEYDCCSGCSFSPVEVVEAVAGSRLDPWPTDRAAG